jgi:hypothetical protein
VWTWLLRKMAASTSMQYNEKALEKLSVEEVPVSAE